MKKFDITCGICKKDYEIFGPFKQYKRARWKFDYCSTECFMKAHEKNLNERADWIVELATRHGNSDEEDWERKEFNHALGLLLCEDLMREEVIKILKTKHNFDI